MNGKLPIRACCNVKGRMDIPAERQPALMRNHTGSIRLGCRPYNIMSVESISDFDFKPFHILRSFGKTN